MTTKGKPAAFAVLAFSALAGGCTAAMVFTRYELPLVTVGFLVYVFLGSRALTLWGADDKAFDPSGRLAAGSRRAGAARLAMGMILLAVPARAQQTIFNVPSADVLEPGKVYVEVDELFRATEPKFSSTTARGVVGLAPRIEAGVNLGGLVSPGPVIPTATVAVKLQPVRAGEFTLTAGGYGLFYLEGSQDGNPAGLGYGFASYRIPKLGTRIELGGWYSSAGYAKPTSTGGALATLEQPLPWVQGLTLSADWWSGENAIGYVSPGFIYTFGHRTAYAAYSIKNGDSRGNAGLIELGHLF